MNDRKESVALLGVPTDLGANRRGTDVGPSALRYAQVDQALARLGFQVKDCGNVTVPEPETQLQDKDGRNAHYLDTIAAVWQQVAERVSSELAAGRFPLALGGDHSVSVGIVAGMVAHSTTPGLIWFDAHGDYNDPETSPSGNVHGMPLAVIAGDGPAEFLAHSPGGTMPLIAPDRIVVVGARSLDPAERDKLHASPVTVFSMRDIDEEGIGDIVRRAIEIAGAGSSGFHVSFDADVIDPGIAMGVGTPVRGGLTYREAHLSLELVAETGQLRSLDLVEVNPILDESNRTAELGVELIASALGKTIL